MKKHKLVLLLMSICSFYRVSADQVSCEKIGNYNFNWGKWKTCYMDKVTEINSFDTTIASRDDSIQGIYFWDNKKIKFLPVALSEKFTNLLGLGAGECSLTTISKLNFKGLNKLRFLSLRDNQIEQILSDVFDDLVALETLHLYNNKLKIINGQAFAKLIKLKDVYLSPNPCINEDFNGASRIAVLQRTVNEKCSFDKLQNTSIETSTMPPTEECESITKALEAQAKVLETQNKAYEAQTKTCKEQQVRYNEELLRKIEEINENKEKIKKLENQIECLINPENCK